MANTWDRLIKGGFLVDPANGKYGRFDLAIEAGRIAAVAPKLEGEAREVTFTTAHVFPGLVDPHLHLGSVFGSPYGARMAAMAGVTTCLDMAGPFDDVLKHADPTGSGINVASIEGFSPGELFGTLSPTDVQMRDFIRKTLERGSVGVKLMGGHWPLPLETSRRMVELCNEAGAYVAWHAGSETAGSNILGMREAVEAVRGLKLHLAHINAYCRGRVRPVLDEVLEAEAMLSENPGIWSESYVSPMNGTILTCDAKGDVIDHVTRTCLASFGLEPTRQGIVEAIRRGCLFVVRDTGLVSELTGGDEAIRVWEEAGTATAGSFPVNPALSRFYLAQAKRADGTFLVDALSTDGGCIPRNVTLVTGLSLVKFGALTLNEFVLKASLTPARHLRLFDRGQLGVGAAADVTIVDLDRQRATETIVAGRTVMKDGILLGSGTTFVTTAAGREHLEKLGFGVLETDFSGEEPERIRV